jgi:hypothetical protein
MKEETNGYLLATSNYIRSLSHHQLTGPTIIFFLLNKDLNGGRNKWVPISYRQLYKDSLSSSTNGSHDQNKKYNMYKLVPPFKVIILAIFNFFFF